MKYEIKGSPFPAVICHLDPGEQMVTEGGGMSWMSPNMQMETTTNGGLGKMFGRMLSHDKIFQNRYTCQGGEGVIAFAASAPGDIKAVEVKPGQPVICQKSAFLASTPGINMSVHFQHKLSGGLFGGEGFIMQRFDGQGLLFIEIDGSAIEYSLAPGESLILDTGHVAMMDGSCQMSVQAVKGLKNMFFGGEGVFNTVVTGPGRVIVQTMPIAKTAMTLYQYMPHPSNT